MSEDRAANRSRPAEIVLVEDSPTQIERLKYTLEQQHYHVRATRNGVEALALLAEHKPDLILSDVTMPEMDGYELAQRIKADESLKDIPVILLTSLSDPHDIVRGLLCGADNFITKPYDDAYLLSRVQYILANRELRRTERVQMGIELRLGEQRYFITSERQQILDLLISTYETAVQKNQQLIKTQQELQALNEHLEEIVQARTAELAQANTQLQKSEAKFRTLIEQMPAITYVAELDEAGSTVYISPQISTFGYSPADYLADPELWSKIIHPDDRQRVLASLALLRTTGEQSQSEYRVVDRSGQVKWLRDEAIVVKDDAGQALFHQGVIIDVTERKQSEMMIKRQFDQLAALRAVDLAITSSLDLRLTLNIFLEQVITQMGVDAADILLLESQSQTLGYVAGRGFRTSDFQQVRPRLGEGRAGRAALERCLVVVSEVIEPDPHTRRSDLLLREGFVSYYGMPLIAKGQVLGVLELFHRTALSPDQGWLEFLEALAGQAAIAIENATLFDGLQRSNQLLVLAYDATIEGWSAALDIRDKETEGHTLRVTEMAMQLARAMWIGEADLAHFRRGALLHDIGKMGIPDAILLKPGPLTDEEWAIMRQHPTYARQLLAPIAFLQPAIDIPYCHHEKWDGSGYPHGLKAEQIPLSARVFAVVDVWDALRSDRPYRPGWPEDKVLAHIGSLAGSHFDPQVVEVFLRIIRGEAHT